MRLVPRVGAGATETDYVLRKRLTGTGPVASVDERGFFQFRGVSPGAYRLEGLHPGFATAVLPEVDILAESETSLEAPLLLRPPIELRVVLDPPVDALDRPWQVTIARFQESEGSFDAPIFDSKASLGGVVRLRDVTPGRYWISAADTSGARLWSDPEVHIGGLEDSEVAVDIDYLAVHGTLRYGDEPVAGQVWFGGRHGLVRSEVETDPDGHFEVLLPRAGLWTVEVELSQPAVRRTFRRTLERGTDGWAELELTVPATRIFGRVVDEAGRPVAGARAFAAVPGESRQTSTTDSSGRFEIHGAPVGEVALSAESTGPEELAGESLFLQLFEDQELGPVEIALTKRRPLNGRIVDRSGPVAGALVSWLVLVPETVGSAAPALTDHQGRFALSVPGRARELLVTIAAPGRALSVQRLPVRPEVDLVVESAGGDLALDVGSSRDLADATGREGTLAFFVDGLPVGTATLARWARDHGASAFRGRFWRLPRLSPGLWSVCLGSEPVASGVDPETWRGKARCAEGWVVPGGRLELALEALETRSQR
ncbi:MAG: carboxypeptidase-like regulatory domain-containing protein [Thermoanaerobaculia bacterium]|nr:carboxypeptidase-like regulatory domain-containing protein [Thermoanaerobaculia bacterium]